LDGGAVLCGPIGWRARLWIAWFTRERVCPIGSRSRVVVFVAIAGSPIWALSLRRPVAAEPCRAEVISGLLAPLEQLEHLELSSSS
jgi:hypothetical protein